MTVISRAFRRHPRRWIAVLVTVLLVVVAAVWLSTQAAARTEPNLATARLGPLDRIVAVAGTVQPTQRADLDFPAGGEVVSVTATVGQQVTAGQPLAAVDAGSLSGQVAQARSALASAEARLAADEDADASAAQLDADRAAVDAAQAQLDAARQNESNATLTAPFNGTVAAVNVTVGEQVSVGGVSASPGSSGAPGLSGGSGGAGGAGGAGGGFGGGGSAAAALASGGSGGSGSGTAAVVVVSTGSYVVDATVDDTQVGQLRAGLAANIFPGGAATSVPGTVDSVALVATSTTGVASYPVQIAVTGSPPGLYIGSSAQVEIVTERISDAILVPASAVRGVGADATVTVYADGQEAIRPVTVGPTSGGRTQIISGLSSGEQVVLPEAAEAPAAGGFGGGFGGGGGGEGAGGGEGGGSQPQEEPQEQPQPGGGS